MDRWRYFLIFPNNHNVLAHAFYAPNLTEAFKQARAKWPWANRWECKGE